MIYLSHLAHPQLKEYLLKSHKITEIESTDFVSDGIDSHPDLYLCDLGLSLFFGDKTKLAPGYPQEVRYNAASTGKYFIHNLKYTDPNLLRYARLLDLIPVHVNQGYTKCNIVVVDEDSVITEDSGMAKSMKSAGLNVLPINPGHVTLPGYSCGFLGGASGKVDNEIIFHGNLSAHPDEKEIVSFIRAHGLQVRSFEDFALTDIGSIIYQRDSMV